MSSVGMEFHTLGHMEAREEEGGRVEIGKGEKKREEERGIGQ